MSLLHRRVTLQYCNCSENTDTGMSVHCETADGQERCEVCGKIMEN